MTMTSGRPVLLLLGIWTGLLVTCSSSSTTRAPPTTGAAAAGALRSTNYYTYSSQFGDFVTRYVTQQPSPEALSLITDRKPPCLCIHGFGGNADQFRYNLAEIADATGSPCHSIDLLGYGYSDKPNPKQFGVNALYNFENWADQACALIRDEIKEPTVLICNSVGGVVGLQAAVSNPDLIKGLVLIDISLRMLNTRKMSAIQRPFVGLLQNVLRETNIGKVFFDQIAQPDALKNILNQAYAHRASGPDSMLAQYREAVRPAAVTDETVDLLLAPGLLPGAVDVFLDFISYSGGPLPEDLLPLVQCPVRILWGEKDPWEPIALGREAFAPPRYACVDEFVPLPNCGHCPMDQDPALVNQELVRFISTMESS